MSDPKTLKDCENLKPYVVANKYGKLLVAMRHYKTANHAINFGRKPGFIIDSDQDPSNYRVIHEVEVPHEQAGKRD